MTITALSLSPKYFVQLAVGCFAFALAALTVQFGPLPVLWEIQIRPRRRAVHVTFTLPPEPKASLFVPKATAFQKASLGHSLAIAPRAATHSWHIQFQKCSLVTSDSPLLASATLTSLEPRSSSYQFSTLHTRR